MLEETVHFGVVGNPLPEWRSYNIQSEDDDNDEDNPIEDDVKAILGFDPDNV